jgi:hypothetical protein
LLLLAVQKIGVLPFEILSDFIGGTGAGGGLVLVGGFPGFLCSPCLFLFGASRGFLLRGCLLLFCGLPVFALPVFAMPVEVAPDLLLAVPFAALLRFAGGVGKALLLRLNNEESPLDRCEDAEKPAPLPGYPQQMAVFA